MTSLYCAVRRAGMSIGVLTLLGGSACKDFLSTQPPAAGTTDPRTYNTPDGVAQQILGVRGFFQGVISPVIFAAGTITDELYVNGQNGTTPVRSIVDLRQLPEGQDDQSATYAPLQNLRVQAALALAAATTYAPNTSKATRAELFAIQGYAEVWLAELYCSGVPLSMPSEVSSQAVDYHAGSPSDSLYGHAAILFDSALVLGHDSVRIVTLARLGKARALLGLDSLTAAAAVVAPVHTSDQYAIPAVIGFGAINGQISTDDFGMYSASDGEGEVGRLYRSSNDPRTPSIPVLDQYFRTLYYPEKYASGTGDSATVVLAGGIEARLIEAEAALTASPTGTAWLDKLNALRTTGLVVIPDVWTCLWGGTANVGSGCVSLMDPNTPDSTFTPGSSHWAAGTGGVPDLPALTDPGAGLSGSAAMSARIDTLFAERSAWLYLTGHRQGDLRRLARAYHRDANLVYPHGTSPTGDLYGAEVTLPIPKGERNNPLFKGCLNRDP